jgi:hypothetical protein
MSFNFCHVLLAANHIRAPVFILIRLGMAHTPGSVFSSSLEKHDSLGNFALPPPTFGVSPPVACDKTPSSATEPFRSPASDLTSTPTRPETQEASTVSRPILRELGEDALPTYPHHPEPVVPGTGVTAHGRFPQLSRSGFVKMGSCEELTLVNLGTNSALMDTPLPLDGASGAIRPSFPPRRRVPSEAVTLAPDDERLSTMAVPLPRFGTSTSRERDSNTPLATFGNREMELRSPFCGPQQSQFSTPPPNAQVQGLNQRTPPSVSRESTPNLPLNTAPPRRSGWNDQLIFELRQGLSKLATRVRLLESAPHGNTGKLVVSVANRRTSRTPVDQLHPRVRRLLQLLETAAESIAPKATVCYRFVGRIQAQMPWIRPIVYVILACLTVALAKRSSARFRLH